MLPLNSLLMKRNFSLSPMSDLRSWMGCCWTSLTVLCGLSFSKRLLRLVGLVARFMASVSLSLPKMPAGEGLEDSEGFSSLSDSWLSCASVFQRLETILATFSSGIAVDETATCDMSCSLVLACTMAVISVTYDWGSSSVGMKSESTWAFEKAVSGSAVSCSGSMAVCTFSREDCWNSSSAKGSSGVLFCSSGVWV